MDKKLTWYIFAGMLLGVLVGWLVNMLVVVPGGPEAAENWIKSFGLLSGIFLSLINMLVAPLILSTIIAGIAHMGDSSALGRIGFRAITWFIVASLMRMFMNAAGLTTH